MDHRQGAPAGLWAAGRRHVAPEPPAAAKTPRSLEAHRGFSGLLAATRTSFLQHRLAHASWHDVTNAASKFVASNFFKTLEHTGAIHWHLVSANGWARIPGRHQTHSRRFSCPNDRAAVVFCIVDSPSLHQNTPLTGSGNPAVGRSIHNPVAF